MAFGIVGRGDGVAERVGDRCLAAKRIVGVSRFVAKRVDRPRDAPLRVVDGLGPAAASVDLRDLPAERVVGVGRGYARGGT